MINILQGDWIDRLKELPDGSIQTCVTSPPYWGLRDYGVKGQLGLEKTPEEYVAKMVEGFGEVRRVLREDGTLWLNLGDSYSGGGRGGNPGASAHIKQRTNGGSLSVRGMKRSPLKNKDLIGIPWMVAFALRADGWYLRSDIVWAKPNCMPESVTDRPTRCHEYLFLLSKSSTYFYDADAIKEACSESFANDSRWRTGPTDRNEKNGYHEAKAQNPKAVHRIFKQDGHGGRHAGFNERWDQMEEAKLSHGQDQRRSEPGSFSNNKAARPQREWRNKRDVWWVSPATYPEAHFATFPPDLIKPCILAGSRPGDTVLDPFCGSGTTGKVSIEYGRKFVGIELNPAYIEMAERRCNVTPGLRL